MIRPDYDDSMWWGATITFAALFLFSLMIFDAVKVIVGLLSAIGISILILSAIIHGIRLLIYKIVERRQ